MKTPHRPFNYIVPLASKEETPQDIAAREINRQMSARSVPQAAEVAVSTPKGRRNIYVVGYGKGYASWMQATELVDHMEDADLVCLTGGEDVNPAVYNQPAHETSSWSDRDYGEIEAFNKAVKLGIPVIGICRGAQLQCALSGGILVQHQGSSGFTHPMYTHEGKTVEVTSCHHQAMYPWRMPKEDYQILGWTFKESRYHLGGYNEELILGDNIELTGGKEIEMCLFPKTRSFSIQGHPEMAYNHSGRLGSRQHQMIPYCRDLLNRFLASGGISVDAPVKDTLIPAAT